MPKFYPHNLEQSRAKDAARMEQARKANAENGVPLLGEHNLLQLEDIAENGLPNCYSDFPDFLNDFYPDFSWSNRAFIEDVKYVLNQTERLEKVATTIKEVWNYDIKAELLEALADAKVN